MLQVLTIPSCNTCSSDSIIFVNHTPSPAVAGKVSRLSPALSRVHTSYREMQRILWKRKPALNQWPLFASLVLVKLNIIFIFIVNNLK